MKRIRLGTLGLVALGTVLVVALLAVFWFSSFLSSPASSVGAVPTNTTGDLTKLTPVVFNSPVSNPANANANVIPTAPANAGGIAAPSQGDHSLFLEPADGMTPLLNAITNARTSLAMKMYLLSETAVTDALIKASKERGIKVRVLLEQHPYGSGPGNDAVYQSLQAAGISVKWANPVFRLTHEKSLLVDEQTALIMTLNLTHSAFISNREYAIVTTKPAELREVLDCFNADWDRNSFVPPANSALLWSNANSRAKILAFIDGAQKTLWLEQEEMQDQEVEQHLIEAARRGVKVQVLVQGNQNSKQTDSNRPGEQQLASGGIEVKLINGPYMHAKIYLADSQRVMVCSENVSTSSLDNNRELGIIVSDPFIVQRIDQTFQSDWGKGNSLKG